jgi:hypothetical protein
MRNVGGIGEIKRDFWWRNLRKRDHLKDINVDGTITLRCIFKHDVRVGTGSICFRIGTDDGLL